MEAVQAYSDSDSSSESGPPVALPKLNAAPDVDISDELPVAVPAVPVQIPRPHWNPAGEAIRFAVDDAAFSRGERAFGKLNPPKRAPKRPRTPPADVSPSETKRKAGGKKSSRKVFVPWSEIHISSESDYKGRSWVEPPSEARTFEELEEYTAYIPKRCISRLDNAHAKGASVVRFFPEYGHLLLSAGLDGVAKIWGIGDKPGCIRSYHGHENGIRDICYTNDGAKFLTASYDRTVKLWDTESGRVLGNFVGNKAIPFCVKFNPDEDKQNEFLMGCSDKKVVQIDVRDANNIVQSYDQHMGAVNSLTFVDDNRRFVSSADDKVLRVWEYGIPVVIKYISDPSMHSMPVVSLHPNRKWLACQSMDNNVTVFSARDRFKLNTKKSFRGHLVAGYACALSFSPDGRFLASGDSMGRAFFWDWRSCSLFRAFQAHQGVCMGVDWHPSRTSLVATCGWDGNVCLWD